MNQGASRALTYVAVARKTLGGTWRVCVRERKEGTSCKLIRPSAAATPPAMKENDSQINFSALESGQPQLQSLPQS